MYYHALLFISLLRCLSEFGLCVGGSSVADGPVASFSPGKDEELDVETVHTALREFQQEFRDVKRDRVCETCSLYLTCLNLLVC